MPIFDESLAESRWRQELAEMEETVRKVRDEPPAGIPAALLALDLATFVKRRDQLRRRQAKLPAETDRQPKRKRAR
jgi:hypothetical protein